MEHFLFFSEQQNTEKGSTRNADPGFSYSWQETLPFNQ